MIISRKEIIKQIPNFSRYLKQFLSFPETSTLTQNIFNYDTYHPFDGVHIVIPQFHSYLYTLEKLKLKRVKIKRIRKKYKKFENKSEYNKRWIELTFDMLQRQIPKEKNIKKYVKRIKRTGQYQITREGVDFFSQNPNNVCYYRFCQVFYGIEEISDLQMIIQDRLKTFLQMICLLRNIQKFDESIIKHINNPQYIKKIGGYGPRGYPKPSLVKFSFENLSAGLMHFYDSKCFYTVDFNRKSITDLTLAWFKRKNSKGLYIDNEYAYIEPGLSDFYDSGGYQYPLYLMWMGFPQYALRSVYDKDQKLFDKFIRFGEQILS